jgi:hypothetical protein
MKREADFFEGRDARLVYIAKRLREALALEELLTSEGIDYLVEADRYRGGFIFQSERVGAFFYVADEQEQAARGVLERNRYRPFKPLEEE